MPGCKPYVDRKSDAFLPDSQGLISAVVRNFVPIIWCETPRRFLPGWLPYSIHLWNLAISWSHGPMINHLVSSVVCVFGEAFDDETSTFTCRTAESQGDGSVMNRAGYNITLCPEAPDFQRMGAFENQARTKKTPGQWRDIKGPVEHWKWGFEGWSRSFGGWFVKTSCFQFFSGAVKGLLPTLSLTIRKHAFVIWYKSLLLYMNYIKIAQGGVGERGGQVIHTGRHRWYVAGCLSVQFDTICSAAARSSVRSYISTTGIFCICHIFQVLFFFGSHLRFVFFWKLTYQYTCDYFCCHLPIPSSLSWEACRGASPGDSKEEYYILHNKVTWSCLALEGWKLREGWLVGWTFFLFGSDILLADNVFG